MRSSDLAAGFRLPDRYPEVQPQRPPRGHLGAEAR